MSQHQEDVSDLKGVIAWMAQNPVTANLLVAVMLLGGLAGLYMTKQEIFPAFELDSVVVAVPYPGATPNEVEQGVVLAVEEAVRGVDGVKRVTSVSSENVGRVTAELLLDADADKVVADIKSAVDRIRSFPVDAEDPVVEQIIPRRRVISLVLAGESDLTTLHALGERARADLIESGEVTEVDVEGVPARVVWVDVAEDTLAGLGLTHDDVARQIAAASVELPAGSVRAEASEVLVRLADRARTADDFADVVLKSTVDGAEVRLGDVATITEGFDETDQAAFFNGQPAVRLTAFRVGDERPNAISAAVRAYADELRGQLPPEIVVDIWDDDSEMLKARIDLLLTNGAQGGILVLVCLTLLLRFRLAAWVAFGIPTSFAGAFLLMPGLDISINMVSLFAFIVTLGMVVDDAIVIGENIHSKIEAGIPPLRAAIVGTQEMAVPVTFSVLTTMAAFAPLLFIPGTMGKIFFIMPILVISVLGFSLLEGFLALPAHLAHSHHGRERGLLRVTDWFSDLGSAVLDWVSVRLYQPVLKVALGWRYASMALAVGGFVISLAMCATGRLPFNFFPVLEGDTVTAYARLPYGTPVERTDEVRQALEASARVALAEYGGDTYLRGMYTAVGEGPTAGGPGGGTAATGSHLVTIQMEFDPFDVRGFSAESFAGSWRAATPPQVGLDALIFSASLGPSAGAAVDVQLSHRDTEVLAAASEDVAEKLRGFPNLVNVENGWSAGKPQLDLHFDPAARSLGLTGADVARQVRTALYGAEALREQDGRLERRIMVRLPEGERTSEHDVDTLLIRTPAGGRVPLADVADVERGRSPTSIVRDNGRRVVNVKASKAPGVKSVQGEIAALEETDLPELLAKYPGLDAEFAGQQREQGESLRQLGINYLIALVAMYAMMAIPFKSYTQPIIVMLAIPFGIIGVVGGHMLLGYELSIISMFGVVAMSGVVVNDSIVMVDAVNTFRAEGRTLHQAVVDAGVRRLRPIFLTSATTFLGLAPMLLETSVQARFLIPMAVSLAFGVAFSTTLTLFLVPATYLILEDAHDVFGRAWAWLYPAPRPVGSASKDVDPVDPIDAPAKG